MLGLRPYRTSDAATIITWCDNTDLFYKWTAGIMGDYPLTAEGLNTAMAGMLDNPKFFPFVAFDEQGLVGFFILRQPGESIHELRFGFVIVDPAKRGKGYGKQMLQLGMRYAYDIYGAKRLTLGVFANNQAALYCYQAAGFKLLDETDHYTLNGQDWLCLELAAERNE